MNNRPSSVNICGIVYSIEYKDNPSEVDLHKREALWGEMDPWTHSIRIYDNGRSNNEVWSSIIHEILHGIAENLKLKSLQNEESHDDLGVLALALCDTFTRNGWLTFDDNGEGQDD